MVTVTFRRDSRNRLSSVFSDGHAELAAHGQDIVCAAVSAILQAALLGLTEVAEIPAVAQLGAGRMTFSWPADVRDRDDVRAIVATAERSIRSIAHDYPKHVRYQRAPEP